MANEEWKKTRSTGKPIIMMVKSLRQLRYCIDRRGDEVTVTYGYVLKIECVTSSFLFSSSPGWSYGWSMMMQVTSVVTSGIDSSAQYGVEWSGVVSGLLFHKAVTLCVIELHTEKRESFGFGDKFRRINLMRPNYLLRYGHDRRNVE